MDAISNRSRCTTPSSQPDSPTRALTDNRSGNRPPDSGECWTVEVSQVRFIFLRRKLGLISICANHRPEQVSKTKNTTLIRKGGSRWMQVEQGLILRRSTNTPTPTAPGWDYFRVGANEPREPFGVSAGNCGPPLPAPYPHLGRLPLSSGLSSL